METLSQCPVCANDRFSSFASIPDHFLTKEEFQLVKCNQCSFLFTNPRPDQSEISRYYQSDEYLSHSGKKAGWLGGIYNFVRTISLNRKHKLISKHLSNGTILDIGCGTGEFLNFMKGKGWQTTGVEPAGNPRKYAREHYKLEIFEEDELDKLPIEQFDVITLWHVLEHVPDLNLRIRQIKRLLKTDGLLVIALPNHESWDANFYQKFWAAWDVPRHFYHFSKRTFSLLMKNHQMEILSTHPMKLDAYYISLLSEKYKYQKPGLFRVVFNGLRSNKSAIRNDNNYSSLIFVIKKQNI